MVVENIKYTVPEILLFGPSKHKKYLIYLYSIIKQIRIKKIVFILKTKNYIINYN